MSTPTTWRFDGLTEDDLRWLLGAMEAEKDMAADADNEEFFAKAQRWIDAVESALGEPA